MTEPVGLVWYRSPAAWVLLVVVMLQFGAIIFLLINNNQREDEITQSLNHAIVESKRLDAELKAAKAAQKKACTDNVHIWSVASIHNETKNPITFRLFYDDVEDGTAHTLSPGKSVIVWGQAKEISIEFDASLRDGYQEGIYSLQSANVIDHKPDATDQLLAPHNSFSMVNDEDIEIYTSTSR